MPEVPLSDYIVVRTVPADKHRVMLVCEHKTTHETGIIVAVLNEKGELPEKGTLYQT